MADKTRLKQVRAWMKRKKIDALIVPHSDFFQSEYLEACNERLAWLTGFTGSNGQAIVTAKDAVMFTDSRYTLQAGRETKPFGFVAAETPTIRPSTWLTKHLKKGQKVAIDPDLFTVQQATIWQQLVTQLGGKWVETSENPIDTLWHDRPAQGRHPAEIHPIKYAGIAASTKIKQVIAQMNAQASHMLIANPGLVCWLLNIRGRDVAHVPVLQSMALVGRDGKVVLFTDTVKISAAMRKTLGAKVSVQPLDKLAAIITKTAKVLQLDPSHCPLSLKSAFAKKRLKLVEAGDPCMVMRACKNATEIKGAILAHKKDAAAFKKFLAWFGKLDFTRQKVTELDIVMKLRDCREADPDFIDDSFSTIAGFGANGAIVHYKPSPDTNKRLTPGNLLLLDSGAQYRCGTTDITRVLAVGKPTKEMTDHYNAVYRGLTALSETRFPMGTTGAQLEAIARRELWTHGLEYGHGTGHGVGSFMSVHEGPQGFTPHSQAPLLPGMILSVEPGVYHKGKFGIRLENLVLVTEDKRKGDMKPMLKFRTLTDVAFDKKLLRS
jgi:Xaa-Pro aminopeptidase